MRARNRDETGLWRNSRLCLHPIVLQFVWATDRRLGNGAECGNDKSEFVTEVFAMKGIKIELLGIATILLGIAVTTNNFFGYALGVLGFGIAVAGCFLKDKH